MTKQEFFKRDYYAANTGIEIVEMRSGYALCKMLVKEEHLNAGGVCQGGALFTLADFVNAIVMNIDGLMTFGVQSSISFIRSARLGEIVYAESTSYTDHNKLPYISVRIKNADDVTLAEFTSLCYRKREQIAFDD